ncbi:fimbrial protein [uncultured Bacteroides sp.]|uniref:fimbrial tip adhesin FimD n=1 Tax=uncultured Bacteroides sp. TaxID=162156 RepID=UPI0026668E24|nr:fimbrial protein [uncultured Bacteroides sp.]
MKKHGLVYSMVVLLAWLLPACTADDDLAPAVKPAEGLTISLETPGVLSRATEAGNDALNENTISQAQLLIFKSDGTRTRDGYRSFEFTDGKTEAVIATGNWKNNTQLFDEGADATYDIYVVANAHEGSTSLQNVETLDDLLSAVDEDADIWKLEGANIGTGTVGYTDKRFAMSGVSSGFVPNTVEDEYTISVTMERLAAKVEVNIFFSDEFKAKFKPTGFYSSLRNYATRSLLRADKEESFTDRGIAGNRANDPMVAAPEKDFDNRTAKLVLYTYPTDWGGDVLQETFVLLNMPGNYTEQEGAQPEYKGSNYYKIPVRLGDAAAHQLNRNTIYRVNVMIDRMGQPQLDVPVELTPKYEVIPWTTVTIDVDNGDLNYLEVVKDEIIMKNIEKSEEQYFTSSSSVTASIEEVYYYDKYGAKQTISSNSYGRYGISVKPAPGNFGNVTINSDVPTNNGIRYIKVKVTNGQGLSKEFTVKQYPLEYIVTVPGWYSYRTDNICDGSVVKWEAEFDKDLDRPVTSANNFSSKVYDKDENKIYTYNFKRDSWWVSTGWWGQGYYEYSNWKAEKGTRQNGNDNNNMYFVRITKTSNEYVLSVPAMDKDGYTESSPENNQLVAPAFMIASQLGTVYPQRFNDAKEHCKQYAEKSLAGEVYDDWRLPTEAELEIIDKYQNTAGSVIDEVLGGKYYWAASGKAYETQKGTEGTKDEAYIRCIRTVQANEPIVEDKE